MVGITTKNIIELITEPESISDQQLSSLTELAKKYPFSGLVNTLLAKVYHFKKDIAFHNQLEKAAFTICDRKVLYKYIHRPALIRKIKSVIEDEDVAKNPIQDDDPQLLELERNIVSAAINLSIQQEVETSSVDESIASEYTKVDLTNHEMPLTSWLAPKFISTEKSENQEKIIDDFIQGKQLQKSTPFFSPLETAKLSLVDNDEFVTETLAEIHVKQGNYPKAIKIYENLMLKFPEKNTFFASRIRFIQEKSNYK